MNMNNPSRWMNYLGLRADQNPISDWDTQPTARLSWNLQPNHTLWGSLSQAARAPSRSDSGFNRNFTFIPENLSGLIPNAPNTPNTLVVLHSNEAQESEKLEAAEIGLRSQWAPTLSTDLVAFTHRYENMLRTNGITTVVPGFPLTMVHVEIKNGGEMTLNGIELAADWRFAPAWHVHLAQTWNHVAQVGTAPVDASGTVPDSITSLRLSWVPSPNTHVDAWLRHTAARSSIPTRSQLQRQAFSGLDLRMAWRPKKSLELSLTGQNLNAGACDAFVGLNMVASNADIIPSCQPRSLTGQLRMDF